MKCNKCNTELPENAKFCLMCGTEVIQEYICESCGHKLEENARFCMLCGTPVNSTVGVIATTPTVGKKCPNVGDIISYGKENRLWIVLDVKDDKALLLTQGVVSRMPYHKIAFKDVTWKESSLYNWINKDFINNEFEKSELSQICTNEEGEKLFLLNAFDAEKYNEVLPILSEDAKYGWNYWWWIQTSIEPTSYVPFVRPYEERVDSYGNGACAYSDNLGVRLAMWIRL